MATPHPMPRHRRHPLMDDGAARDLPGTGHGLLADTPGLCDRLIMEFLTEVGGSR